MNEVLRTIAQRYSCRAFDGRAVEKEKLQAIATAAVQAPSGMNVQPWHVAVVTDKAFIEEMDADGMAALAAAEDRGTYQRFMERGGTLFYNAPCMFVITMDADKGMDVGIVSENIALAAASLGLGSCICGMARIPFDGAKGADFQRRAGFGGRQFGVAVLVGYASGEARAPHAPDMDKVSWVG